MDTSAPVFPPRIEGGPADDGSLALRWRDAALQVQDAILSGGEGGGGVGGGGGRGGEGGGGGGGGGGEDHVPRQVAVF
jgi:hypothetical protein